MIEQISLDLGDTIKRGRATYIAEMPTQPHSSKSSMCLECDLHINNECALPFKYDCGEFRMVKLEKDYNGYR